jgi:hypothetical protein
MFYNYLSSWGNVFTKKIGEDNNYINFEASPYGFYPSAIGTKACPVCRDPGAWSDCIGTKQSRTKYICDESTSYECVLQSESRTCCGCTSGEWSSCSNGIKTRTTYDCNSQTGFQCSPKQESETCISDTSQQTAQNAIASAETAISNAKNNKKDTSLAKTYLSQAENFMATNDYTNAFTWANKAKEAADTAPDISSPAFIFPVPIEYLIIIIVAVVGSVAGFFVFRKIKFKIPTSSSKCIVCNNPTQMKFVCTSCKNNACFKDSRVYQGNIYCINCLKKMGFK